MQVAEAYQICREIARKEAKNFYYSFVALPPAKRNAICAVYAFMRHADDLSDDESLPIDQRRANLEQWLIAWREASCRETSHDGDTNDPVFVALSDAQRRFDIPNQLLEQLVEGTTMDLSREAVQGNSATGDYQTYPAFADLYQYCYLVASVVGLVCIRIFGYQDKRAEKLAEETGIAFQLTNILRDVREDAERRRVYLPREDLGRFGVSVEQLSSLGGAAPAELRELLRFEAERAERYYQSGRELLPLIVPDSRPAMWVLITIYHRLLHRIKASNYEVFRSRVRVPTYEKLAILAWGILRVLGNRLLLRV
ncbi:Phytoene synthase [Acidisarcina polymorpha]|uniref:Phytoene synthase n=1 Tax=Acidisarcina polymorpha TaxID=2211140 RepID=A0A2Z5FV35_9BACT|nr:phytoene/squalene synthase family protein [Acidisarcina polymorpha]AXC10612.1 Phytoene synthase [Acidisarcina polymorpha]